jgi:hypothetical protein
MRLNDGATYPMDLAGVFNQRGHPRIAHTGSWQLKCHRPLSRTGLTVIVLANLAQARVS